MAVRLQVDPRHTWVPVAASEESLCHACMSCALKGIISKTCDKNLIYIMYFYIYRFHQLTGSNVIFFHIFLNCLFESTNCKKNLSFYLQNVMNMIHKSSSNCYLSKIEFQMFYLWIKSALVKHTTINENSKKYSTQKVCSI